MEGGRWRLSVELVRVATWLGVQLARAKVEVAVAREAGRGLPGAMRLIALYFFFRSDFLEI